jgi:hypothetical protein
MNELSEMLAAANHFSDLGRFLRQYLHYDISDSELMQVWKQEIDFIEWLSMEPCMHPTDSREFIIAEEHCTDFIDGMCRIAKD